MIAGISWWIYLMILFIFLSGYMAFRAMQAERKIEQKYIENEGKVYMDRIEAEREDKDGERKQMTN